MIKEGETLSSRSRNKAEIAQYYGVSKKVVNRWLRDCGLGDLVRRTGSYYYPPAELRRIALALGDTNRQLPVVLDES